MKVNNFYKPIILKDLKSVFSDKLVFLPFIILPVIFCIVLPVLTFVGASFSDSMTKDMSTMQLPGMPSNMLDKDKFIAMAIEFMFPMIFLIIPVMSGSIIAGTGFIGEKENKTIESLLYTRVTIGDLFKAKILSAFIPSLAITVISFLVFYIVSIIGLNVSASNYSFPIVKWLALILWLSPSMTIFAIFMMVLVSAKAKTFQEAQQRVVFIILPIIFLLLAQIKGLFDLNALLVFIVGTCIFVVNYFLLKAAVNSFTAEKLVS